MLHIYKKRGASPVTRSTVERPSHCPDCRNEQRQYNVNIMQHSKIQEIVRKC